MTASLRLQQCNMAIKIDGQKLAAEILTDLKKEVSKLKKTKKVPPRLAVIQVGHDPASTIYIEQKAKAMRKIGGSLKLCKFSKYVSYQTIAETVKNLNDDPHIHGIIVQRPLPATLTTTTFNSAISQVKDVDGFRLKSPYLAPIAEAVMYVLRKIYFPEASYKNQTGSPEIKRLATILKNKNILLIGRGETAGSPIAETLSENHIKFIMSHSKTGNTAEFAQEADIIISCVGKPNIVKPEMVKPGAILIGVGVSRGKDGRIQGDYQSLAIKEIAGYYTPVTGGVGPLNVAFLVRNLVAAYEKLNS